MRERPLLGRSTRPIRSLHHAVIRRGADKHDPIALIVCAYAGKSAAPRDATFEMIDVRRFKIRTSRLIVVAVLV